MSNPETARRMALWVIELSKFNIQYLLLFVMKGQVVTDFISKFTNMEGQGAKKYP